MSACGVLWLDEHAKNGRDLGAARCRLPWAAIANEARRYYVIRVPQHGRTAESTSGPLCRDEPVTYVPLCREIALQRPSGIWVRISVQLCVGRSLGDAPLSRGLLDRIHPFLPFGFQLANPS